ALARQYADAPNVEINDGYLGLFKPGALPLPLEVPLFELAVGPFDATVETRRGFPLLMRHPVRRAVARHILISWSGARDATAGLRRNRAQAELLVDEVLAMFATDEVDFCDLSSRFSDDPESRFECGLLGVIEPAVLPRPMEAELFSLRPGEVSGKIETEFGFHILKRDD
nr:peptidylprolyl isomerase [bacterium]